MKKYMALLLALVTVLSLTACGKKKNEGNNTTEPSVKLPSSALNLLQTVWNSYAEEEKFYAMGGNYSEDESKNNNVENAPGKYDLEDEGLTANLMVPAEQVGNISEAASLVHGMMTNNFTCGAYRLKDGMDAKAFSAVMYTSITQQRFLCGTPEWILIATLGDEYVVAVYGAKDLLTVLQNRLTAAYPGTEVRYNEAITG